MQNFISKQKLSKKMQRELNSAKRRTWGSINPATRKPANPKAYNRRKVQKGDDYTLHFEPFLFNKSILSKTSLHVGFVQ